MFYVTIDCGTTNSRAYIVDSRGKVYGKAVKQVGVRDTAVTGSKDTLREGLHEVIEQAAREAGTTVGELGAVLSSGMITSEIGLFEIPHLTAPAGTEQLAETITRVPDAGIVDGGIPVYFVRGIKNHMDGEAGTAPSRTAGELDFMRGEETQTAGILMQSATKLPAVIVILSSHTKFIGVDSHGMIRSSLTTMSGQVYDAVRNHTFIGKSVIRGENDEEKPKDYFNREVIDDAVEWVEKAGLLRSLMFPRFMDVLLKTRWYERGLFLEAMIAADDMQSVGQLKSQGIREVSDIILVGKEERCRLYEYILQKKFPASCIRSISDEKEIDELSIQGILAIARRAGIVDE